MKDIVYAGFAQLSYLDWDRLEKKYENTTLKIIFDSNTAFNQIKTSDYKKMETDGRDYYLKKDEKSRKIYNATDARSFYLYSEDGNEPNMNPLYSEFGDWEFVWGYDHKKILKDFKDNKQKPRVSYKDSGFQASVFKKDNQVIIAYRGTNPTSAADWFKTNTDFKCGVVPDALNCAVWLYEKVATDQNLSQCEIYVTGHSMGGALAQYIAVYGYKATKPVIYITDVPFARAVAKTATWNALGVGNKKKGTGGDIYKIAHLGKFVEFYDEALSDNERIVNFFLEYDTVPDIQNAVGLRVQVDKRAHITGSSRGGDDLVKYHSVANFMPFFNEGNITPMQFNDNFLLNSIKQAIKVKNNCKNNEIQASNYLESFGIEVINKYADISKIIENSSDKKNSGKSMFFYCMKDIVKEKGAIDWFLENEGYVSIGLFNNMDKVSGVEGGEPIKIEIQNNGKNGENFESILNIMLPKIDNKSTYIKCDIEALKTHIAALEVKSNELKDHPMNYQDKPSNKGYVDIKIEKKIYENNYYKKESNKFGAAIIENDIGSIHLGCDFSYGRENPICCSHPNVYSPVFGKVIETGNGKIIIENKETKKTISGEELEVPYYHIVEHLHEVGVKVGMFIKQGEYIGKMGGVDTTGDNKYRYLQHVHYGIMLDNENYTGKVESKSDKKILKPSQGLRYINPEKFWDEKIEDGIPNTNLTIVGGIYVTG